MAEKWEYGIVESDRRLRPSKLDVWGDGGWELVSHVVEPGKIKDRYNPVTGKPVGVQQSDPTHIYTFKRSKK